MLLERLITSEVEDSSVTNADELRICPEREQAMSRKIEDTYGKNPMKVLSNEETNDFNKQNRRRVEARTLFFRFQTTAKR